MQIRVRPFAVAFLFLFCATSLLAVQRSEPTAPAADRTFRVEGVFRTADGQAAASVETVRFAIYAQEVGGDPLWQETQSVAVDSDGRYSVLLGSAGKEEIPLPQSSTAEPRWFGVFFQRPGEKEQPRTLVTNRLQAPAVNVQGAEMPKPGRLPEPAGTVSASEAEVGVPGASSRTALVSSGTAGRIGKFVNTVDLGNSVMFESAGNIGLGTPAPVDALHVAFTNTNGAQTGYAVQNLGATAASYSGNLFYDQAGVTSLFQGFNNSTHEYRINNIASGSTINFMIGSTSRFLVDNGGNIGISQPVPGYRLDVSHAGGTGVHVKGTAGFSVVDIDGSNGDSALRFLKNGVDNWLIRNNPTGDALQFFEFGGGGERMRIDKTTGKVWVVGDFTTLGVKLFTIDHPLDPDNKVLRHAAAESNEVINFYSGNVTTDENGRATVALPDYFGALNKDPRYNLTVIGVFAQAIVFKEVKDNQFEIATSEPNVRVSWEVKGVRNDARMRMHPFRAEEDKDAGMKGTRIDPSVQ